ncbi:hypothetical protein ACIQM0_38325, partial [Streptomyces sp. NPDC091387]|uniref:hypothetical protein n=1 Tax=Streptomyces sp. NPDC091387 TaxID=3365998 RepID=UPI00381854EE
MPRHQTTQTTRTTRHQHHTITHKLTLAITRTRRYLHQTRDQHLTPTHRNLRLTRGQHHTRDIPEHPTRSIHIDQHKPARILRLRRPH